MGGYRPIALFTFTRYFLVPSAPIVPNGSGAKSGTSPVMKLITFYIVFVAIGEAIAYFAGRTVELWSEATSLPVFLMFFFVTFWVAWRLAVRLS